MGEALLKLLAASVTCGEIVPKLDIILATLPTEKNFASAYEGGEVDQPPIEVLHLDLPVLKTCENLTDGGQRLDVFVYHLSTEVIT